MNGSEAARRLRTVASLISLRDSLTDEELSGLVALSLFGTPFETLSMKRAAAGRRGGIRSAESRLKAFGTAQPMRPPNPPPNQAEKQAALASPVESVVSAEPRPPLVLPSDPDPEEKKNKSNSVRAREGNQERRPTCLPEALELGSMPRAELVLEWADKDPTWVREAMQPSAWPEVQRAAEAYAKATGRPGDAKLGDYKRDAGTQALVQLLALHIPSVVYAGIPRVVSGEWFQSGKRGLSSITPEVFRRDGLEQHAPTRETPLRAPETSFRIPVDVVPPPPEVNASLDALAKAQGGKAGLAAAKRAREAT